MARRGSTRAPSGRARAPPSQAARSVATRTPTPTRTPTRTPRLRPEPRSEPRVGVVGLGVGLGDLRLTPAVITLPTRQLVITLPRRLAPAAQGCDLPARRLLRERGQGERRCPAGRGRPPLTWLGLRFRARFERVSRRKPNPANPTQAPTRTRSLAGRGRQLRGGGGRGQVGTAHVEPGGRPARGRPPRGRRRRVRSLRSHRLLL